MKTASLLNSKFIIIASAMALALSLDVGKANATLIDDTVTVTNVFGSFIFAGPTNVVVQEGVVELPNFGFTWDIDIEGSSIHLDPFRESVGAPFTAVDEYHFESLNWVGIPDGIIVGVGVEEMGFSKPVVVTFDDHTIWVTFASGTIFNADAAVWIDIRTNHDVPEPATLALFGFGLLGLGLARRRRREA